MKGRITRRVIGWLRKHLPQLRLGHVADPRRRRASCAWSVGAVLNTVLTAMVAGCRSLKQMEDLSMEMSPAARRALGMRRRLPDTTARDLLCALDPDEVRVALSQQVRQAHRRKALQPVNLPFGVVSFDGRSTSIKATSGSGVQRHTHPNGEPYGQLRTITSCLVSSRSKACIDVMPISGSTNEMGTYPEALEAALQAYGTLDLFRLVTYDSGGCSRTNARFTREHGLDYLFRLNQPRERILLNAKQTLGRLAPAAAAFSDEEAYRGRRIRRSVFLSEESEGWPSWTGCRTVIRVFKEDLDDPEALDRDRADRYFVSSLPADRLTPQQWLTVIRSHWGVENNCHHTFDAVLDEDARPWVTKDANAALVLLVLRRIAYNLLATFRAVAEGPTGTRSQRFVAWRDLIRRHYNALIAATEQQLADLLPPRPAPS